MSLRTTLTAAVLALLSLSANAQDLLARQAPIDRRLKGLDSISLYRFLPELNYNLTNPGSDLYPDWNNNRVRMNVANKPSEFRIDLRGFCMPCDSRLVTSHYGYRASFGRNHEGTDIKLYTGDTVRSAFNGKIRIVAYERGGYGNYVVIRHDNGLETVYGHLSKHLVKTNQTVRAGEPIGLGGNTGRSTGSHLHFETRFLGEHIDPEVLFDFRARDSRGDFYTYRSHGRGTLASRSTRPASPVASSLARSKQEKEQVIADASEIIEREVKAEVARNHATPATEKKKEKSEKTARNASRKKHEVKAGDTLYSIAKKNNTTVEKLCKLNHISERTTLRLGQTLRCS